MQSRKERLNTSMSRSFFRRQAAQLFDRQVQAIDVPGLEPGPLGALQQRPSHLADERIALDFLAHQLLAQVARAPALVGRPHAGIEAFVLLIEGIHEEVFPLADLEQARHHGIAFGRQPVDGEGVAGPLIQIALVGLGREPVGESQLRDGAKRLGLLGREFHALFGEIVGDAVVEVLESILLTRLEGGVGGGSGFGVIRFVQPNPSGGIAGFDPDFEDFTSGFQNAAFYQQINAVGFGRQHPDGPSLAALLQGGLQMVGKEILLGFADLGMGAFLARLFRGHRLGGKNDDAHVQQLLLGNLLRGLKDGGRSDPGRGAGHGHEHATEQNHCRQKAV
jgi:hypothetical protein